MRDWHRLKNTAIPKAIVTGFGYTARRGRNAARSRAGQAFKLHSNYIPKSILSIPDPDRAAQIRAASKGLTGKYGNFVSAVFVKGADIFGQSKMTPKKDLGFMSLHEEGGKKESTTGGMIAIPARGIKGYQFRTSKGRVKKKFQPSELLKRFNEVGAAAKGRKRRQKRSTKGAAFMLKSKSGRPMIVRRKTRKQYPLEILYMFFESAQIKRVWGFVKAVEREVRQHIFSDVNRQIKRIK